MTSDEDVRRAIREEGRQARRAGRLFADACVAGDIEALYAAVDRLNDSTVGGWPHAFRALPEMVHPDIAPAFLPVKIENKSIALDFDSIAAVVKGLRKLLPPYEGPSVKLYRGQAYKTWKRRSLGVSWTTEISVAEKFATDNRQAIEGGSVILETIAPPEAIIAALNSDNDHYNEREYFVDPRHLGRVSPFRRYPQISYDEALRRNRAWLSGSNMCSEKEPSIMAKQTATSAKTPKAEAGIPATPPAKKVNDALMKPMTLSKDLIAVVGKGPMPRTEVVSKMWAYIKKHELQNPANKRNILADAKLKPIFGKDEVTMFEMTKLISAQLT